MTDFEERVTASLHKVVEGREDYVYDRPHCLYVDPTTLEPLCIWGHVLIDLGVDPEVLASDYEIASIDQVMIDLFAESRERLRSAAVAAQGAQDGLNEQEPRKSWGEVRRIFDNRMAIGVGS
jgi:hypothetical protein